MGVPHDRDRLIQALSVFTRAILLRFDEPSPPVRDIIIRNFIGRSLATLASIGVLARRRHTGDCWTLFRSMVDRLFHLHWLGEKGEFEAFEEWSFVRQYEDQHRANSDPKIARHRGSVDQPTPEQKKRYRELKQKGVRWSRPHPEDASRSLEMPFLYKYGYDFASSHVHPMANDGESEVILLARGESPDDHVEVLENAILVYTLILQEALNHSSRRWAKIVYDFVEVARAGIVNDAPYEEVLLRLLSAGPEFRWSDASSAPSSG